MDEWDTFLLQTLPYVANYVARIQDPTEQKERNGRGWYCPLKNSAII